MVMNSAPWNEILAPVQSVLIFSRASRISIMYWHYGPLFLSIRSSLRVKSPPRVPLNHPTSWITCLEACSQISTDLESRLLLKESVGHARNPSLDRWNSETSIYPWQSFRYSISTCLCKPAVIFQLQLNPFYLEVHRFSLLRSSACKNVPLWITCSVFTPGGDRHGQNVAPRALCVHPLSGGDRLQELLWAGRAAVLREGLPQPVFTPMPLL